MLRALQLALLSALLLLNLCSTATMAAGRNISVIWFPKPVNSPKPTEPLRLRDVSPEDTLVFRYLPIHTVYLAASRADQLACVGEELCTQQDSPCRVPMSNFTNVERAWFFCIVHCPRQNLVVNFEQPALTPSAAPNPLAPSSGPIQASPSAAPAGRVPSAAPIQGGVFSPSAAPSPAQIGPNA